MPAPPAMRVRSTGNERRRARPTVAWASAVTKSVLSSNEPPKAAAEWENLTCRYPPGPSALNTGPRAAWPSGLGRGLQSPAQRFDSARRLCCRSSGGLSRLEPQDRRPHHHHPCEEDDVERPPSEAVTKLVAAGRESGAPREASTPRCLRVLDPGDDRG